MAVLPSYLFFFLRRYWLKQIQILATLFLARAISAEFAIFLNLFPTSSNSPLSPLPPLAGIIMAYGGFKLIISGGNEAERTKGMNAIQATVWGILITFGAYVIVNAIIGGLAGNSISESWYQFRDARNNKMFAKRREYSFLHHWRRGK